MRWLGKLNEAIAVYLSDAVSTMWCAYAFTALSLAPLMWPSQRDAILYISNCFQLVFLPLILVAGVVEGRRTERREAQDHRILMQSMNVLLQELELLKSINERVRERRHV